MTHDRVWSRLLLAIARALTDPPRRL